MPSDRWHHGVMARVRIISRMGCHLCEDAEVVVRTVCLEVGEDYEVTLIDDNPDLADQYAEFVPVIMVDGQQLDFYGVDAQRLRDRIVR